jgi:hypothetical protein
MWAAIIAAPETLFRLTFLDLGREHRKLLFQLPAAAVGALPLAFIACVFQQFGYLAAVIAFIFVNRHGFPQFNGFFVRKEFYVMIIRGNNQYQSLFRHNTGIPILTLIAQRPIGR